MGLRRVIDHGHDHNGAGDPDAHDWKRVKEKRGAHLHSKSNKNRANHNRRKVVKATKNN